MPADGLFEAASGEVDDSWYATKRTALRLLPIAGLLVALTSGWMFGWEWTGFGSSAPQPVVQQSLSAQVAAPQARVDVKKPPQNTAPPPPTANVAVPSYVPAVQPGDDRMINWSVMLSSVALVLIAVALWAIWMLRQTTREVHDSNAFTHALRAWAPLVRWHRPTPRAVKRFGNRVRYMVMLQQAEQFDESGWDLLWKRLARWLPARRKATPAPAAPALQEHQIVALGALHEVFGEAWRRTPPLVPGHGDPHWSEILDEAVSGYCATPDVTWPPSTEDMEAFERLLKGIRTGGAAPPGNQ